MQHVAIPDPLFLEAQRVAAASGISLEHFVSEAVQLHLQDQPDPQVALQLSPEQVAVVRRSQAEIKSGKGLTMEQVEELLAAKKAAWLQTPR